jgi:hypothetical protein
MFVLFCVSVTYKIALKDRKIGSDIVVGSENRKEKGGKMSVYSTKKMKNDIRQEIVLLTHATVYVCRIAVPKQTITDPH